MYYNIAVQLSTCEEALELIHAHKLIFNTHALYILCRSAFVKTAMTTTTTVTTAAAAARTTPLALQIIWMWYWVLGALEQLTGFITMHA